MCNFMSQGSWGLLCELRVARYGSGAGSQAQGLEILPLGTMLGTH